MTDVSDDTWHVCGAEGQNQRQIVLVFQGGGALGAYQADVYQALHEAGVEPDWIIGTSIGAINASVIAGMSRRMSGGPRPNRYRA
jgi:NTE family protein